MYEGEPFVEIVVQPKQRVRFRYESEKSCAAIIYGENSQSHQKTYPTIRIRNYCGKATLIVSCVSSREPHCPHPHKLIGDTRNFNFRCGACCGEVTTNPDGEIQLPGVGIQRTKRELIRNALQERKAAGLDPFRTNFAISERVNLHAVCLCFQVYLPDLSGKYGRALPPVVSKVIQDKKSINDLAILRVSRSSGSTRGGDEVFLLCDTVNKEDIRVRFYDENDRGEVVWESFGTFAPIDVYHGNAIVFKTPSYPGHMLSDVAQYKEVSMQLYRPSTEDSSKPVIFTYMLHHQDPDWIEERRGRKRLKPMPDVMHAGNSATFDTARPVSVSGDRSSTIVTSTSLRASAVCLPTVLSDMNSQQLLVQSTNPRVAYGHPLHDFPPNHAAMNASDIFNAFPVLPTHAAEGTLALPGATKDHDSQFCGGDSQVDSFTTISCAPEMSFLQLTAAAAAAAAAATTTTTAAAAANVPREALFRVDAGTAPVPDATSAANTPGLTVRDAYEVTSSIKSLNSLLESLMNTGEP